LFRHHNSGFELKAHQNLASGLSLTWQARIFSRIFRLTDGNPGSALLTWLAGINDFKNKTIEIKPAPLVDYAVFSKLDPDIKMLIVQFMLHKRLTSKKICRITLKNYEETNEMLKYLKRAGLIRELAGDIFEIERYMIVHLRKWLNESKNA
jgi:hypothetical protein